MYCPLRRSPARLAGEWNFDVGSVRWMVMECQRCGVNAVERCFETRQQRDRSCWVRLLAMSVVSSAMSNTLWPGVI